MNSRDIEGIFVTFGKIQFCRLKLDNKHNSLGKALIIYEDPKSAVKAIQARGAEDVLKSQAFQTKESLQRTHSSRLFVKHLPYNVTEEAVRQIF